MRTITHSETFTGYPTSYDTTDHQWYSASSMSNGYTASSSTTYATIGDTRGANAETWAYFNFDTSSIPNGATISSISCTSKAYASGGSAAVPTKWMCFFSGTTQKGNTYTLSTSTNVRTLTLNSGITLSDLRSARIKVYAKRGTSSNLTSSYVIRFYGATLTVKYSYIETLYLISGFSNSQNITITMSNSEVHSGENCTVTISGNITGATVTDNGIDITSSLSGSGNTHTYTLSNITSDHNIVVSLPSSGGAYYKTNGQWVPIEDIYIKQNGVWNKAEGIGIKESGTWKMNSAASIISMPNYNIHGYPTIFGTMCTPDDSTENFVYTKEPFNPGTQSWIIQTKLKFNSSVAWRDLIASVNANLAGMYSIVIQRNTDSSNQGYGLYLSNNGSSWNITNNGPKGVFATNTWRKFQLVCTKSGNNYIYKMGYPELDDWTSTLSTTSVPTFGGYISFGGGFSRVGADCEIDLSETKIWVGDQLWWSAIETV